MYAPAHPSRLWYRQEGAGLPVVLLHGLADTHDLWRHQIPALAASYRVIAFDLRGHGRSPHPGGEFTLRDLAEDVRRSLDGLGIQRAVVVGLSMGGGVAQTLALEYPERILALGLVSTSSEFPDETRERFVARAAVAEREGMEAVVEATVPRWFTPRFTELHPDEVERTRRGVLAIDPAAFAAASRANAVRDLTARLGQIRCPVLFMGGSDDPARPQRALEIYRRTIPDLRAELLDGASHLVPVEAPNRFNALLLAFLASLDAPADEGEAE